MNSKDANSVTEETLELIGSQYLSYRDFALNFNELTSKLIEITQATNIKDLCKFVAKSFKESLSYEKVNLWVLDHVLFLLTSKQITGVLKTYNENGEETKIISNKGLIGECVKLYEPVFKKKEKEKYLYKVITTGVKINKDDTLLNPIRLNNTQINGVLEVNFIL